jgi:hypothetical protein
MCTQESKDLYYRFCRPKTQKEATKVNLQRDTTQRPAKSPFRIPSDPARYDARKTVG